MTGVLETRRVPRVTRAGWIVACAAAEAIGMAASAAAARGGEELSTPVALALVVLGGLVEGTALGVLQARWLVGRFPISQLRWIVATVLIAGVGWAVASAPGVVGPADGDPPPMLVILVGAAGLGLAMGAVLGVAQSVALRGAVPHPWRWVLASAVAWTPTMPIIFLGATLPDASWPAAAVVVLGAVTGATAGATFGVVSFAFIPTLDGTSAGARIVTAAVTRNVFGIAAAITVLEVVGVRTGRRFRVPVQYARDGDRVVVYPAGAERKTWWRNFREPHRAALWIDGGWSAASGVALTPADPGYPTAIAAYARRWPRLRVASDAPVVCFDLRSD